MPRRDPLVHPLSTEGCMHKFKMLDVPLRPLTPQCHDAVGDEFRILMLPCSNDGPSTVAQSCVIASIASYVAFDLFPPPLCVGFRWDGMFGASVPEAAVDEDCNACTRQHDIWGSRQITNIYPKPKPSVMQFSSESQLWFRSLCPEIRHETTHCRTRGHRRLMAARFGSHR